MAAPPQVKICRDNHLLHCIVSEHFREYSWESGGLFTPNAIVILLCACLRCARREDGKMASSSKDSQGNWKNKHKELQFVGIDLTFYIFFLIPKIFFLTTFFVYRTTLCYLKSDLTLLSL